jgi:hypothetical protein
MSPGFSKVTGYGAVNGTATSRVLVSIPSRYYCAIGLGSWLGLEGDAPHIRARFPTHATLDNRIVLLAYPYGPVTLSEAPVQGTSGWRGRTYRGPNSTSLPPYGGGFGLPYTLFDRLNEFSRQRGLRSLQPFRRLASHSLLILFLRRELQA